MEGREHEPKDPYVFHAIRVRHLPKCIAESEKHGGNSKCVKARKVMNSDGSRIYTQGPSTTYLYPVNTWEVGHRSRVSKGVVWRWGERGSLFWGSRSNFFGEKCLAGMASHPKKVRMSWNYWMHAIEVGEGEV